MKLGGLVVMLLLPSWESHSATVLPTGTRRTARHSDALYRTAGMIDSLRTLHGGNPRTVACTTDFSKRDLMATSERVPPDVPLVAGRGIYAIAHGAGRSHSVAARFVVAGTPRARAPPRGSLTQAAGRWVATIGPAYHASPSWKLPRGT